MIKAVIFAAHTYGYAMEKQHVLGIRSLAAKYAAPKLQAELGADFDYEKVRSLRIKLMNEHIDAYGVEEKPGLGELLAYLKQNAYLTAVATATDWERTKRYLGSIGRLSYFDEIVCAPMVANGKPAPDIYLEAARRLNVEPSQCMALEDSPNGILAAYRAGMYPVMVPDLSEPDEDTKKLLYRCVGDLSQVIDLMKNI